MIKVLNLYAGIGGNRKLWKDVEVTAIENNSEIAKIYQDFFPKDKVIVADAHQYLLEHFEEFDFIWSSPPCMTHSAIRRAGVVSKVHGGQQKPVYPDMSLYQEILFLKHHVKVGKWVVENVIPYYKHLIEGQNIQRHLFWANFKISNIKIPSDDVYHGSTSHWEKLHGVNLKPYKNIDKRAILRSCVNSKLGLHIFNMAFKDKQRTLA